MYRYRGVLSTRNIARVEDCLWFTLETEKTRDGSLTGVSKEKGKKQTTETSKCEIKALTVRVLLDHACMDVHREW